MIPDAQCYLEGMPDYLLGMNEEDMSDILRGIDVADWLSEWDELHEPVYDGDLGDWDEFYEADWDNFDPELYP